MSPAPFAAVSDHRLAAVRLIVSDVDNTLTRGETIPPEIPAAFAALAAVGTAVLPATGRAAGVGLGLATYTPHVLGVVAENGGVWMPAGGEVVRLLHPEIAAADWRTRLGRVFDELRAYEPAIERTGDDAFRLTEVTFRKGAWSTPAALAAMRGRVTAAGFAFTWSQIHCHLHHPAVDKGTAALALMNAADGVPPGIDPAHVLVVGDSPNDRGLFRPGRFGVAVGVANVAHHLEALGDDAPAFVTARPGADGFLEIAAAICRARGG